MRPVCTWNVKYSRRELGELFCASQTWKSNTTVPHIKFCIPVPPGNMCNLLSPQLSWLSRLFRTTATLFSLVTRPPSSSSVANSFFFLELCVVQVIYKPRQTVCRFISTKQPQTLTRTSSSFAPDTILHSLTACVLIYAKSCNRIIPIINFKHQPGHTTHIPHGQFEHRINYLKEKQSARRFHPIGLDQF